MSPLAGDIWFNTSTGASFIYYNSAWVELGGGTMSPYQATSSTRPSSPWTGQLVYETDTQLLVMYNGGAWVQINSALTKAPRGVMAYTELTTNTNNFTTIANAMTATFTAVANRYYKITYFERYLLGNGGVTQVTLTLANSATVIQEAVAITSTTNGVSSLSTTVETFTAGSITILARLSSSGGTSSTAGRSTSTPAFLLIEDIGSV